MPESVRVHTVSESGLVSPGFDPFTGPRAAQSPALGSIDASLQRAHSTTGVVLAQWKEPKGETPLWGLPD